MWWGEKKRETETEHALVVYNSGTRQNLSEDCGVLTGRGNAVPRQPRKWAAKAPRHWPERNQRAGRGPQRNKDSRVQGSNKVIYGRQKMTEPRAYKSESS